MKDIFSLKNKVAVVTGGSMGIGAMIAEGFLNFGAKVYLVARNADQLKAKQEELSKLGECEIISADLKDIAGIKQLVSQFAEKESRLDILVIMRASQMVARRWMMLRNQIGIGSWTSTSNQSIS